MNSNDDERSYFTSQNISIDHESIVNEQDNVISEDEDIEELQDILRRRLVLAGLPATCLLNICDNLRGLDFLSRNCHQIPKDGAALVLFMKILIQFMKLTFRPTVRPPKTFDPHSCVDFRCHSLHRWKCS
jgi:hypothetical protein